MKILKEYKIPIYYIKTYELFIKAIVIVTLHEHVVT